MGHKTKVHEHFDLMAKEVLAFIKESESGYNERWVPAAFIKDQLGLKMSSYPQSNDIDNRTGWLFSIIARYLEDQNLVEFNKNSSRSFYRSKR